MSAYEVYAIKYAHHARSAKENFLGGALPLMPSKRRQKRPDQARIR